MPYQDMIFIFRGFIVHYNDDDYNDSQADAGTTVTTDAGAYLQCSVVV